MRKLALLEKILKKIEDGTNSKASMKLEVIGITNHVFLSQLVPFFFSPSFTFTQTYENFFRGL